MINQPNTVHTIDIIISAFMLGGFIYTMIGMFA